MYCKSSLHRCSTDFTHSRVFALLLYLHGVLCQCSSGSSLSKIQAGFGLFPLMEILHSRIRSHCKLWSCFFCVIVFVVLSVTGHHSRQEVTWWKLIFFFFVNVDLLDLLYVPYNQIPKIYNINVYTGQVKTSSVLSRWCFPGSFISLHLLHVCVWMWCDRWI